MVNARFADVRYSTDIPKLRLPDPRDHVVRDHRYRRDLLDPDFRNGPLDALHHRRAAHSAA